MLKFLVFLVALAVCFIGIYWLGSSLGWIVHKPSFFYQSLFFVAITTAVLYRYLYLEKRPEYFVQIYLLLMVLKVICYLTYNVFMVMKDRAGSGSNVMFFLVAYMAFTALEIVFLYRKINVKNGP